MGSNLKKLGLTIAVILAVVVGVAAEKMLHDHANSFQEPNREFDPTYYDDEFRPGWIELEDTLDSETQEYLEHYNRLCASPYGCQTSNRVAKARMQAKEEDSVDSQSEPIEIDSSQLDEIEDSGLDDSQVTVTETATVEEIKKADNPAHTFLLVIFIMTIFVLTKMMVKSTKLSESYKTESYERAAYFSLLKDICFMVAVMLVTLIVHYYEGLTSFNTSVDNVLYGMFFFILCWMIFGYLVMKNSFYQIKKFKEYEKFTCDPTKLSEIKKVYENQYYVKGKVDPELRAKVEYMLMKQGFINPIELPTITESFLRRDFNLGLYFGHCMSDQLCNLFSFGYQAYFIVFMVVLSWKIFSIFGVLLQSIFMVFFPLTSLAYLYVQRMQYTRIKKCLVPQVSSPEDINFNASLDVRDPFDQYETAVFPPYLEPVGLNPDDENSSEGSEPDLSESGPKSRSVGHKTNSEDDDLDDSIVEEDKKAQKENVFQCKETFLGVSQNRHERLFWFGKIGIFFEKLWLQCFFVQMILWIAHLVEYKYLLREGIEDYTITNIEAIDYVFMLSALFAGLYSLLLVFPNILVRFMVITHIQMMKRRDLIEETIKEQRYERSMRSFRIYQVFKLIRRELIQYFKQDINDKTLRPFTKKIIEENYSLSMLKDKDNIDVLNITDFFPLCGAEVKKIENFLLLKKAQYGGGNIKFKDLVMAIEQTTNDVKVDPFEVVKTIFTLVMKDKKKLSISDVKQFFDTYEGYFEKDDVNDLLNELVAIQRDGALIDIQEIASLIRDDIECFPR